MLIYPKAIAKAVGSSVTYPALFKYVLTSDIATCTIVPASFTTNLSASAKVVAVALVSPSILFSSVAVAETLVPPISRVVIETSPATVRIALPSVIKSVSLVCPIVVPLIITLSTVKVVRVPRLVIFDCAAVVTVAAVPLVFPVTSPVISPTKAVDVIEVAPVTTPASILIVPSSKIAEPTAGSIFIAAPESKVNTPAESMSTVPSAVI